MKRVLGLVAMLLLSGSAWGQQQPTFLTGNQVLATPAELAGAGFLTRIRLSDPDYRVILMACLKGNELNLLLSRHLPAEEIPLLVRGLAGQLGQTFPGQDLSVVAFRPVIPLKEAAVARLNGQTGEVTVLGPLEGGQAPSP